MPLSIYLDDCSDEDLLIARLKGAGHTAVSPRNTGTMGRDDAEHLEYASQHGHSVLTHNPSDFQDLHKLWQTQRRQHRGILLIYRDNDPSKDMTAAEIVAALDNLLASGLSITNCIHVLNHWR